MAFVTSFERLAAEEAVARGFAIGFARGYVKGLQYAVPVLLEAKFGEVDSGLVEEIGRIKDPALLRRTLELILQSNAVGEVRGIVDDLKTG